ncbi:MAG: serine hydrolase [Alphaproteobacteria bacterium]|nr:serine hydrolase [Alphaproteobacteria bacterium]
MSISQVPKGAGSAFAAWVFLSASAVAQGAGLAPVDADREPDAAIVDSLSGAQAAARSLQEVSVTSTSADEAYVDGLIAAFMDEHGAPGYIASMVRDGEVVFAKGYGVANAETGAAATGDATRFWIGSISKTFVWTAVMMAVDRGEIDLDTDINRYLTSYKAPDADRPLTMNDLMAHRVGLEDTYAIFLPSNGDMPRAEALAATEPERIFESGGRTAYSNWATTLATLVLEEATGRAYEDILFGDILAPLGMTSTTLDDRGAIAERVPVARSYRVTPEGLVDAGQLDLGAFAPIGGMTTTAADMAKWMAFLLGEGSLGDVRLLSEETYALMRERAFRDRLSGADMAHGFQDLRFRDTILFGHGGSINSFLSRITIAPELGVGIFVSQNNEQAGAPPNSISLKVIDRELERKGDMPFDRIVVRGAAASPEGPGWSPAKADKAAGLEPASDAARNAEEVAGRYLANRRPITGVERFLGSQAVIEVKASGEAIYADRFDAAPFRRLAPDVYENRFGNRIAFVRDEAGDVAYLADHSGTATWERVTGLGDPQTFNIIVAAALAFAVMTWLGLWRRLGRPDATGVTGKALSAFALLATAPLFATVGLLMRTIAPLNDQSYAEIFAAYPPVGMEMAMHAASATAVLGGALLATIVPAWRGSGWSLWRKAHYLLFAVSYAAAGFMFWRWGLAFSSHIGS